MTKPEKRTFEPTSRSKKTSIPEWWTTAAAGSAGRCTCEGCAACRGVPGYPCAALRPPGMKGCGYCILR